MSGYGNLLQEITGATGGSTGGQYSFGAWDVLNKGVDLAASSASNAYDNLVKHYGTEVAYQLAEEMSGGAQFRNDGDIRTYLQGALEWGGTAQGGLLSSVRANGNVFTPSSSLVVAPPKPTPPNANQPSPPTHQHKHHEIPNSIPIVITNTKMCTYDSPSYDQN